MPRKSNRREKLVLAARDEIYQRGYAATTLSDIATLAEVPVGNVYYYFKTKGALADAVLADRREEILLRLRHCDKQQTPQLRLKQFLSTAARFADVVAQYGCPYTTLAQEFEKEDDESLQKAARDLIHLQVDWVREQFEPLVSSSESEMTALEFLSRVQGACTVCQVRHSEELLHELFSRIESWIDEF